MFRLEAKGGNQGQDKPRGGRQPGRKGPTDAEIEEMIRKNNQGGADGDGVGSSLGGRMRPYTKSRPQRRP